jgi:hypothetical protein
MFYQPDLSIKMLHAFIVLLLMSDPSQLHKLPAMALLSTEV